MRKHEKPRQDAGVFYYLEQDAGVFYYLEIVISWRYLIGFD